MDMRATEGLRRAVQGRILGPSDDGYEERRRTWNGTIDRRPALIVMCTSATDIQETVRYARDHGLRVAVRGGGHHVAGDAIVDDAVVIDLSPMRGVEVDAAIRRVVAQGGALLGDIDTLTAPHSLAVPTGLVSKTGIGGLTLAGGLGWLRRAHGFTSDNLVSAQVVTADGDLVTANEGENADLLWAMRGGGWGLGVVSQFEFRAHTLPQEVMNLLVAYSGQDAKEVLQAYREYGRNAPGEFGPVAVLGTFPEAEAWPRDVWGQDFAIIIGPYAGSVEEGERAVQPLREIATPLLDMSGPMPFADVQKLFDEDYPEGDRYYWKSVYLAGLGDDAIDKLIELSSRRPSVRSTVDIWLLGGALARGPAGGTPLDEHRAAPFLIGLESNWENAADDAANRDWTRASADELKPFSTGGSYLNFEDLSEEKAAAASRGSNQARLAELKRKYDPTGLFHARSGLFSATAR